MAASLDRIFLDFETRKLEQLASRIKDCLGRLTDAQIWARGSENENAVGNLVLHLCGNVRQWAISSLGGAQDVRVRDLEFSTRGDIPGAVLLERLEATLREAVPVIQALSAARLAEPIRIQSYDVTVLEAVAHMVEHFAMHTGQIIFATKLFRGEDLGYYNHLRAAHAQKTP